jgi:UDP-N-acetylmuramate: L-alanyl-gamma-D-glutamyl-meso-diaminopimelate ligase
LVGEYNVRNAAMAISAAHFYGVPLEVTQRAVSQFEGVKRRQEVRGEVHGITVIDDFGHHPTDIAQTLRGLRHQYPGRRLWALFEPRSNTTRRAVFQNALPEALGEADGVILAQVARLDQLPENDRLNPLQVVAQISARGKPAFYEPGATEIIERLRPLVRAQDVIVIFSNGGFDNVHRRLLAEL